MLRPAHADEAEALTQLCLRSKAMHGYDAAFMAACRMELAVIPGLAGHHMIVAEHDGVIVGVAEISVEGEFAELEKLFVEPSRNARGAGREMFRWAQRSATAAGARALFVDSDPGAAGFYERMGAVKVGSSPSGSISGRTLPRYRLDLDTVAA